MDIINNAATAEFVEIAEININNDNEVSLPSHKHGASVDTATIAIKTDRDGALSSRKHGSWSGIEGQRQAAPEQ